MRLSKTLTIALPVLIAVAPNAASAAVFIYTGTLSGSASVPANGSTATGNYTVTVDDVLNTVTVSLTFTGLTGGNATAAHIHCCVAANANGPVVIPFTGFPLATSGSYTNTFTNISVANIQGIKNGLAYINIHNAVFPGGEIRGQINAPVPEPATWGLMIAGFGMVAGAMRRRRVRVRFA